MRRKVEMEEYSSLVDAVKRHIHDDQDARSVFHELICIIARESNIKLPYTLDCDFKLIPINLKEKLIALARHVINEPSLIDNLYINLVSQKFRRKYGQFITPPDIAKFMVSYVPLGEKVKVLDPAVGTGVFLAEIFHRLRMKDFELVGVDIDTLLLNACYTRLKLLGVADSNLTLIKNDFLSWDSKDTYDLIICNPPYIKFHGFNRDIITRIASEHGIKITQLTNIYALFFIHATKFIKENGYMIFITPSEFLYTGYGQELREFLLRNYEIEAFILVSLREEVFKGAMTTALITVLKRRAPSKDHRVKFIKLQEGCEPSLENVEYIREISQYQLDPKSKWLIYFTYDTFEDILCKLIPLSHIASVDRGIATGYNKFFTLSESTVKKYSISEEFLKPVVSKASHCLYYDFTLEDWERLKKKGESVFLLYYFSQNPPESLKKYLEYGLELGVNKRYIPSHRRAWYMVDKREPAPILALVFSRARMRFILNKAGVLNLTPFHCIYPFFNNVIMLKALLAYLNSNICKEIATYWGRVYGTGLRKLEPRDLENLPVIDVRNLREEDVRKLAELFDELCRVSREKPESEEEIKSKIDHAIKEILSKRDITQC